MHHVDRDLDASTALRFHFGEMALSVPYRMLQIAVIGADAWSLGLWPSAGATGTGPVPTASAATDRIRPKPVEPWPPDL